MMQCHRGHSPLRWRMDLPIDCNNHGGRTTVGADAADIHTLFRRGDLRKPNLLPQAGLGADGVGIAYR